MKQNLSLFLLLIACCTFTSCSILEDREEGDELLGNWKLIEINDASVYDPFACPGETRILIKEDDVIRTTYFDPAADCAEKVSTGTWTHIEEDQYSIEVFPELGKTEGRIDFESINIFDFYTSFNNEVIIFTFEKI